MPQTLELLEDRALLSSTGGGATFDISPFAVPSSGDRVTYDGMAFPGDRNDPEASARALLDIVDPDTDYQLVEIKHGLASSHARFQQIVDGLPVFGSAVSTHQGSDGAIQTLHMEINAHANSEKVFAAPLSAGNAVAIASSAVGISTPYLPPTAEQVWYSGNDGEVVLAWEVNASSVVPVGDFRTILNATTGEVLSKENRIAFATGSGNAFVPNPYQTQGSGANLTDNNDATSAALEAQMVSVTLDRLDDNTGLIKGEWVDLSTLNSPTLADVDADEATRIYNYTRNDPRFEQVVIYKSVDAIQEYFHSLGFDDDVGVQNGIRDYPTLANAHWFTDDQSFYSTANNAIHFGDGGVDDGEDADIIAHEYGHAVQHDQNANWGGGEMGAMGEGFGDYLAASFYAADGETAFQTAHDACVGEWDATSYSGTNPPCLRRVDGSKMYPTDLIGQIHADGEIWSAALWDIRSVLGGPITDTLVLEHHFALPAGATMPVAAQAMLTADENLNGGANQAVIRQAFVDRGILEVGPAGAVTLDAAIYGVGDTITITVTDTDLLGGGPITVAVVSTGGDTEAVTLTEFAGAFRGTITSANGPVVTSNGILEAANGDQITVTYNDADDGSGNPAIVTDTATLFLFTEITNFDFSDDVGDPLDEGFTVSGPANEWHLSTGRGNDVGHTPDDSFYFGQGEGASGGGTHGDNADGTITSPQIDLTAATAAELSFNHFLETEATFDFATVSVIHASGTDQILSSDGGGLPVATNGFESVRFDMTAYLGQMVQIAFRFTSDASVVSEGWYVDDVVVRAAVPIVIPDGPDLVGTGFDAVPDHVLDAETDVTFTVTNVGELASAPFATHVVWSPNNVVGDGDDVVIANSEATFASGLAAGASESQSVNLQLDRAALFAHAANADSAGARVGSQSTEASYLFLIIDAADAVVEEDETNNSGTGRGKDSDDITYFPGDIDRSGTITPLDVLPVIQAIGTINPLYNFDGHPLVTPFEALYGMQRIGVLQNESVIEPVNKTAGKSLSPPVMRKSASMDPVEAGALIAQPPAGSDAPVKKSAAMSVVMTAAVDTDEERESLFVLPVEETVVSEIPDADDDLTSVDTEFQSVGDWLTAI